MSARDDVTAVLHEACVQAAHDVQQLGRFPIIVACVTWDRDGSIDLETIGHPDYPSAELLERRLAELVEHANRFGEPT